MRKSLDTFKSIEIEWAITHSIKNLNGTERVNGMMSKITERVKKAKIF